MLSKVSYEDFLSDLMESKIDHFSSVIAYCMGRYGVIDEKLYSYICRARDEGHVFYCL